MFNLMFILVPPKNGWSAQSCQHHQRQKTPISLISVFQGGVVITWCFMMLLFWMVHGSMPHATQGTTRRHGDTATWHHHPRRFVESSLPRFLVKNNSNNNIYTYIHTLDYTSICTPLSLCLSAPHFGPSREVDGRRWSGATELQRTTTANSRMASVDFHCDHSVFAIDSLRSSTGAGNWSSFAAHVFGRYFVTQMSGTDSAWHTFKQ